MEWKWYNYQYEIKMNQLLFGDISNAGKYEILIHWKLKNKSYWFPCRTLPWWRKMINMIFNGNKANENNRESLWCFGEVLLLIHKENRDNCLESSNWTSRGMRLGLKMNHIDSSWESHWLSSYSYNCGSREKKEHVL